MVKTKPIDVVRRKWEERATVAADDYKFGVQNPKRDWAKATEDAASAWEQGIQAALREKRFVGGVRKAGTDKWQKKAVEVGADRFASGVRAAVDEYERAMGEVLRVIEGVSLPERKARGDPANIQRVAAIADALHKYAIAKKKA